MGKMLNAIKAVPAAFKKTKKQIEACFLIGSMSFLYILLYGGSRSGKTFIFVRAVFLRALKYPNSRHLILRFRFQHAKQSLWYDTIPKMLRLCFPGLKRGSGDDCDVKENKQDWFYQLQNGSQIWIGGLDDKDRAEKILGNEYCVAPDSKILCSDLKWRKARNVDIGQELIAFPEKLEGHIKLKSSTVIGKIEQRTEKYRITTDRGSTIVSANHKFVTLYDDRRKRDFSMLSWRKANELHIGDIVRFAAEPWKTGQEREDGWMAGILDGEGWSGLGVGVAQNKGIVLNKIISWFHSHKIKYTTSEDTNKNTGRTCVKMAGAGMWNGLKLLGITRPLRLKSRQIWENRRAFTDGGHEAIITKIEKLGIGEVISFQTSTKTLIHDGFLGHNCTIYFNECSQLPWRPILTAITRLAQNIPGCKKKLFFDENPPNKRHWSYTLFIKKQDPITGQALPNPGKYCHLRMNPDDNVENVGKDYVEDILGSLDERSQKRFRLGEFLDDAEGALFKYSDLAKARIDPENFDFRKLSGIVVAIDPAVTSNEDSDEHGIVVVGFMRETEDLFVLEDATIPGTPRAWALAVMKVFEKWEAEMTVAEVNNGGDLVEVNLRTVSKTVPYKTVRATRGKEVRAEPTASMCERGKLHMVGDFPLLEEELTSWVPNMGLKSPNRLDALVWGCSYFIKPGKKAGCW